MRLGSLRQLTLVSFFVALIPLIALLWQSQRDLANVATLTARDNSYFVNTVSAARKLENRANDLSRLFRQYKILTNPRLLSLIDEQSELFKQDVRQSCQLLPQYTNCQNILLHVEKLHLAIQAEESVSLDNGLQQLFENLNQLRTQVSEHINGRITDQQHNLQSLKEEQAWSSGILAFLSLCLILLGAHMIVQPFKKLKRIIHQIAQQDTQLPSVTANGPQELVVIERELHWLSERLNQLEHIRTALLRHASHELKTPLASIKEGCSLLSDEVVGDLSESQREVVSLLTTSTERLSTLVEKLLDYNLLLQQAQAKYQSVHTAHVIQQCIDDNQLVLQQHPIDLEVTVDEMVTDLELFRRILDNLVSNAAAHGALDEPISIRVYTEKQQYILDVANQGQRIEQGIRQSLFEPFVKGNQQRNDQVFGAGLGLSIVADCARILQGAVMIADVDYADVCFRVSLPRRPHEKVV